jgi:alpha-glucosidase (family GH31 glycosyl hydrolase)
MVCPITRQIDKRLNLAYVDVYLPKGRWTDIFNGRVYEGEGWVKMYRDLDSIPVLAPEGAIIPMYRNDRTNDLSLDQPLEIHIWRGNGHYELYEDDGETNAYKNGKYAITKFDLEESDGDLRLTITPPVDMNDVIPTEREIFIKFRDIIHTEERIILKNQPISLEIKNIIPTENESEEDIRSAILTRVQGCNDRKSMAFKRRMPKYLEDALSEIKALKR